MKTPTAEAMVRVLYDDPGRTGGRWQPTAGVETQAALQRAFVDHQAASAIAVREEAIATLSNCLSPDERNTSVTGLVVGYVQSGKTMAYTVLSALAHDCGYALILIMTGTIKNLFWQSTARLKRDLGASEGRWQFYTSEDVGPGRVTDQVASSLNDWRSTDDWVLKETVVITVLKNGTHLDRVTALLEALRDRQALRHVPVLVIDDEADQAGLNTLVRRQDESPTYRRIMRLRATLPQHSYLQYTATPQAILLISLMDELSPEFVQLLTPGSKYTGGQTFFASEKDLIETIPDSEISSIDELRDHPPDTLREALSAFVVAAAVGARERVDHRSMLVHPHRLTQYHAKSAEWLRALVDRWRYEALLPENDSDRVGLDEILENSHRELSRTMDGIPAWRDVRNAVPYVLDKISVHELNTRSRATSTDHVDWARERFTVIVGGQKLDRGYTVRGLTTTYMPRSLGVGNADTIQQRARWFGYKEDYLGLCRVYLREDVAKAYRRYVEHEESIREQLIRVMQAGGSMAEWRRNFFLDRDLRPTRSSVVGRSLLRGGGSGWFVTSAPATSDPQLGANMALADRLQELEHFEVDPRYQEMGGVQNRRATAVSVESLLAYLLLDWKIPDGVDSAGRAVTMLQLQHAVEADPGLSVVCYLMRPALKDQGGSRRQVTDTGRIENVFQGRSQHYPGDRYLERPDQIVVQLHSIQLMSGDTVKGHNVPVLALHIPQRVARDWLTEVRD